MLDPLARLTNAVRGTVRYKLLALTLAPIIVVLPIVLGITVYWGNKFTYDQLFNKVNTDLNVAHDVFERIQSDYLSELKTLGESYLFHQAFDARDMDAVHAQIAALKQEARFSYLHLLDPTGKRIDVLGEGGEAKSTPSLLRAYQGRGGVGVEIFSAEQLAREGLADEVSLTLLDTPRARPTDRSREERGMMIRAVYPLTDARGTVRAVLDGGVLLNGNFAFVDAIRDLVYGEGSLAEGSIGTVTVFLEDVRISTNVPLAPGERALGTRVSNEVRSKVLDHGVIWRDRAFVVNDWYISAYEPIVDVFGDRVGMLYAGYLEAPYKAALNQAYGVLALLFLLLMAVSALLSINGAKSIFRPIERMSAVVRATREGRITRVGQVQSSDELGVLAGEFDAMLDLLSDRALEIQQWADQLESKVDERTAELRTRNAELQRTISVLRQTRQQLVVAEKLAALGELTAGVAHEINNPTQVMLGNLEMLSDQLGEHADAVKPEIELVIAQVYRIQEIINNLLRYARPGEYAGYLTDVDVNPLLDDSVKLVQHLRKQRGFELSLQPGASQWVSINAQELQQVLVNLLVNAIHALPEIGGRIQVSSEDWDDKGVVISVRDNGKGMDANQVDRVFNPFFSTKGQGEGTGLGLSVSYGLIRRYGGNISVKSRPGEGSDFRVWLLSEPVITEDEQTIAEQLHEIENHPLADGGASERPRLSAVK
ncbi:MAG: sensor histidine kinase [Gammaproteobacteria bacterium]